MSNKSIDQIIQEAFNHPFDCGIVGCEITEAILDFIECLKSEEVTELCNKKIIHEYSISISVAVESEDIEEVEEYADALINDILGDDDVIDAAWYNITPIRKCIPKRRE